MKYTILRTILFMSRNALIGILLTCLAANLGFADHSSAQSMEDVVINISSKQEKVVQLFSVIESNTPFYFLYDKNTIQNLPHRVTIRKKEQSVADILRKVAEETGLRFRQINETISVKVGDSLHNTSPPTGVIAGRITDAETGEPMPGATMQIEGTNRGTSADEDGEYRMDGVEPGTYTLIFSFVGYEQTEAEDITVESGRITTVNASLAQDEALMDEVVVEADIPLRDVPINNTTEAQMVGSMRDVSGVATGMSYAQISRSADSDAGELAKRLPGVSAVNNFVLVRGMDPRYNVTLLNGMKTPSVEMDTRAFKFNLLPSGVIDQILVQKSPSPELPGNFGGGAVQVNTKNTAIARQLQVGVKGSYRRGSGFTDHIGYEGSSKDWYGGGVEDRQFPALLRNPDYNLPSFNNYPGEVTELGNALPPVRLPQQQYHNFDKSAKINYYDSWRLTEGGMRLNNLTSLNYSTKRKFTQRDFFFDAPGVAFNDSTEQWERAGGRAQEDSLYKQNVRLTAMQNLHLAINDNHSVSFNSFFNRSALDQTLIRQGEYDGGGNYVYKTYSFKYQQQDLYQLQLTGSHRLGTHQLDWSAGINEATDRTPDLQRFNYSNNFSYNNNWNFNPGGTDNARISFTTEEQGQIYSADYTKFFGSEDRGPKIKAGGYREQRDREFTSGRYQVDDGPNANSGSLPVSGKAPWNGKIDSLYTHYFLEDGSGLVIQQSGAPGQYSIDDEIRAGYLSVNIPLFDQKLTLSGGVRYEWNERFVYDENGNPRPDSVLVAYPDDYEKTPDNPLAYWLPSATLSYNFLENTLVRASYGKTIDRPQYREQSNFEYFDFEEGRVIFPNARLTDAKIHNYDVRIEHYPSESEFLAVGAFYKDISDAIERYDFSTSAYKNPAFRYVNTDTATVYGVEAEVRKNLGFIHTSLSGFSVIANAAWIKSRVTEGEDFDRPMQGTSPYLLNLSLYYDNPSSGTKVSAMYNLTGPRLRTAAPKYSNVGGLYERRRQILDLTASQEITESLEIEVSAKNVLNTPIEYFVDGNKNEKYDTIGENPRRIDEGYVINDFIEESYTEGASYSFSLTYSF